MAAHSSGCPCRRVTMFVSGPFGKVTIGEGDWANLPAGRIAVCTQHAGRTATWCSPLVCRSSFGWVFPELIGRAAFFALLVAAAFPIAQAAKLYDANPGFRAEREANGTVGQPESGPAFQESSIDAAGVASVHSASLTQVPGGDIRAFWFGGSREGARDVGIFTALLDVESGLWSHAQEVANRKTLSDDLDRYIKKLGNPVAHLDDSGRLWLHFVSVSVGGWATSALNVMVSDDGGETFGPAKRLTTSPFFNVSTLVRTRPVPMQDGSVTIPVHHQFIGKFAELMLLRADGVVLNKSRLSARREHIQPALVPSDSTTAGVFMRCYSGCLNRKMHFSTTKDAGLTWTRPRPTNLPNWNSSVAAVGLPGGDLLLAYNHSDHGSARNVLSLAVSGDTSGEFRRFHDLENSEPNKGRVFSYPAVLRDGRGWTHVAYTYDRRFIKHVMFNDAWLSTVRQSEVARQ